MKFPFIAFSRDWFTYVLVTGYETYYVFNDGKVQRIINKDVVTVYVVLDTSYISVYNAHLISLYKISPRSGIIINKERIN